MNKARRTWRMAMHGLRGNRASAWRQLPARARPTFVTGLATAHMDSIPVIAITGQVRTDAIGSDAFQEADTTGITRPVTKHNYLVKDVRDLAQVMREAFHIATSGRPGPVLIDVPCRYPAGENRI